MRKWINLLNEDIIDDISKFVATHAPKIGTRDSARNNPKWVRYLSTALSSYGFEKLGAGWNGVAYEKLIPASHEEANVFIDEVETEMVKGWSSAKEIEDVDLREIVLFMIDWSHESVLDLTSFNIMKRQNGQLVIIDPLAEQY